MSFTRLHEESQSSIWVYDQGHHVPSRGSWQTDSKQGSRQTSSLKVWSRAQPLAGVRAASRESQSATSRGRGVRTGPGEWGSVLAITSVSETHRLHICI